MLSSSEMLQHRKLSIQYNSAHYKNAMSVIIYDNVSFQGYW
jgi:hypothetical protein